MKTKKQIRPNVQISDETYRELKAQAAYQDITIQQAITQAIEQWLLKTVEKVA